MKHGQEKKDKMFNINKAIKKSKLGEKIIKGLKKEIHKEFPNDRLMYKLHFIRALKNIKEVQVNHK